MKRDPKKHEAWRRRSKGLSPPSKAMSRRKRLQTRQPLGRGKARLKRRAQPTTGLRLWVRAKWVCAVPGCGRRRPDPHHVDAKGMGRRCPDRVDRRNVAPLCREHHSLGDSPGWSWVRFQAELGVDLEAVRDRVWEAWMQMPEDERARWVGKARRINSRNGAVTL